jgi:putative membrane protein
VGRSSSSARELQLPLARAFTPAYRIAETPDLPQSPAPSRYHESTVTTATNPYRQPFRRNVLLHLLTAWYALVWIVTAIRPIDPRDWFLENIAVAATLVPLAATYRRFQFSDLSYLLLTAFLTIHAIGAHYSYARVPFGFWMQETFDLTRNHFDRIAHFSFGLFLVYPFREIFLRLGRVRRGWEYFLPLDLVLSLAGLYEISESWVVRWIDPNLGALYLGSQGDIWDAQKDMTMSLLGAILAMAAVYLIRRRGAPRAAEASSVRVLAGARPSRPAFVRKP